MKLKDIVKESLTFDKILLTINPEIIPQVSALQLCCYTDRFFLWRKKKDALRVLLQTSALFTWKERKDRLTTCRTLLIHWKLSSSDASGRCSATSTIRSSCKTVTENTAILKHKGQKNDRMQHVMNIAWFIITWKWLQSLMVLFQHTQAFFMPDHHKITDKFKTDVSPLLSFISVGGQVNLQSPTLHVFNTDSFHTCRGCAYTTLSCILNLWHSRKMSLLKDNYAKLLISMAINICTEKYLLLLVYWVSSRLASSKMKY